MTTSTAESTPVGTVHADAAYTGGPDAKARHGDILLVVPPFQTILTPSIGVSQLKANLDMQSFRSEILYLNFQYAERIGIKEYETIVSRASTLFGDYVFSRVLYGYEESELEQYVREPFVKGVGQRLLGLSPGSDLVRILHRLVEAATEWVDSSARMILDRDPWMVGFTSMFQQNC